jgi:RNA ligase (TIGR02306 family)
LMKGDFPCFIPKTSQDRVQNLKPDELALFSQMKWEITEKLDGSSMTVFIDAGDEFCVCSRNVNLSYSKTNAFWMAAKHQKLEDVVRSNPTLAIQGELIGEGIQKNPYKISMKTSSASHLFYVFDVYDVKKGEFYTPLQRQEFVKNNNLLHVPIIINNADFGKDERAAIIKGAEGKSDLCATMEREGLVYKCITDPKYHFKAISNAFLLKHQ